VAIIETQGLTKKFGELTAVDKLDLAVDEGEVFGLLGPNGAGKTTIINMLVTLMTPSRGDASVNGFDVRDEKPDVRKSIGIVFQDPSLDDKLTAEENMEFHGRLYGVDKKRRAKRIKQLLKLVELWDRRGDLVEKFSGGMKRRLEIARGLMHRPKILFLDEPTLGLDPATRRRIWDYIGKLNRDSDVTIILTTHYMDEAEQLCDRVAIIDHGKVKADDTPDKLKETVGGGLLSVEAKNARKLTASLKKLKWVKSVKSRDGRLELGVSDGEHRIVEVIERARKAGVSVKSVTYREPTLEDVFLHYTGKTMREREGGFADTARGKFMKKRWAK